jgi:N6-L-threonylcarbamoyladenine synthase
VETLLDQLFDAVRWFGAQSVGIAGGVSANSRLRETAATRAAARGIPLYLPSLALSTDNAAMIAAAGLRQYRKGLTGGVELNADAALPLNDHRPS